MPFDAPAPALTRRLALQGLGLSILGLAAPAGAVADDAVPEILVAAPSSLPLDGPDKPPVPTLAYDDLTPGPQIRVRQGKEVFARLVNKLDRPTGLHWHGVRLPNAMDGVPGLTQAAVPPGGSFDYHFKAVDAGTYFYRPPTDSQTGLTPGGLYGVLVVEEAQPPPVDRDLVFVLDSWRRETPVPLLTVNSKRGEEIALRRNERLRLRFVNAATFSIAALAFAGISPIIVALDGQPVNTPFPPDRSRLDLAPGGRADLIVDGTLAEGALAGIALLSGANVVEIVRIQPVANEAARAAPLPPPASLPTRLPEAIDLARASRARLDVAAAKGRGVGGAPLFSVKRGTPVTLAMTNGGDAARSVHLHGHSARVLHALDDGWEPYWLDSILVGAGETVQVAFVADNPGKWLLEMVTIDRPGSATARWFEVR